MNDFAGELLILTGPPGSGKTTISAKLAQLPGSRKVHIHTDDFWHFVKAGKIEPFLPDAHEQNAIVVNAIAKAAAEYAKGEYFVIVDGVVGPWFLPPFIQLNIALHYIVLYPSLDLAIQRCQQRDGQTLVEPKIVTALHRQFSSLGSLHRNVIPITDLGKSKCFDAVLHALQSGDFLLKR